METKVVIGGIAVLALALLCGYGDLRSGTNDYGASFGSAVNGFAAMGTVVAIAAMAVVCIKSHLKK